MIARIRNAAGVIAGYGGCYRCGDTWNWKTAHSTPYEEGRACFPLCEECWSELTPDERLPYYEELVAVWGERGSARHRAIIAAARAGL